LLRRIFRPNREKVAGGCRTLHNEELQKVHFDQSKKGEMGGECRTHGRDEKYI